MTTRTDLDTAIVAWLAAEAPDRAPDDVIAASRERLRNTHQRRPLWPAGRLDMRNFTLAAAALAAALVLAVGAVTLGPLANSGKPTMTPGQIGSPTPDASAGAGSLVILDPGTHSTTQFRPALTYAVPAGWALVAEDGATLTIAPAAFTNAGVTVCRDPQPGDKEAKPVSGVGTDAEALATWLAGRPEVGVITGPTPWAQGGLEGYWFDLRGREYVNVIGFAGGNGCGIDMYPDQRIRLGFLDAPDATLLVYIWDVFGGETYIEAATDVIETFAFDVP